VSSNKNKHYLDTDKYKVDFVKLSKYFFTFSIIITLIGVIMLSVKGLNYGVDFREGSSIDVTVNKAFEKDAVEQFIVDQGYKKDHTISVSNDRVTIRLGDVLTHDQELTFKKGFQEKFDPKASFEINTVDVEIARELQTNALLAVAIASIGIIIYVSIRFEWRFAIAAIIALLHTSFIVISVFSIFRLEVNLTFILAILTIIGYSINDTVVIFDRIRENLRFAKLKNTDDLMTLVNHSISQTMTRSINTVFTVFIAAFCLLIFGSESIRMFSLAMTIGLVCGAYTSIFIASPLWLVLKNRTGKKPSKTAATKTS
jgi:SecD/SecF fusion protein